jgi:hypothetical protein
MFSRRILDEMRRALEEKLGRTRTQIDYLIGEIQTRLSSPTFCTSRQGPSTTGP